MAQQDSDDPLDIVADALAAMKRAACDVEQEQERDTEVTSVRPDPQVTVSVDELDLEPGPVLRFGAIGPQVARLQHVLIRCGADPALAVTGAFDHSTLLAVRWFQGFAGLKPDGEVTSLVWKELLRRR
jgi:peptidoglycan hydrolase-like protein with peptidoglycan-binding domain